MRKASLALAAVAVMRQHPEVGKVTYDGQTRGLPRSDDERDRERSRCAGSPTRRPVIRSLRPGWGEPIQRTLVVTDPSAWMPGSPIGAGSSRLEKRVLKRNTPSLGSPVQMPPLPCQPELGCSPGGQLPLG